MRQPPDGPPTIRVRGDDIAPPAATNPGMGGVLRWTAERGPGGDRAICPDCEAFSLTDNADGSVPGFMRCDDCGSEFVASADIR